VEISGGKSEQAIEFGMIFGSLVVRRKLRSESTAIAYAPQNTLVETENTRDMDI
jgi:hypothetical protein